MTSVKFLIEDKVLVGFELSGHCSKSSDDVLGKIVCAAVSSAAYLTANTVTEIIGDKAEVFEADAKMRFKVLNPSTSSVAVLEGLKLHLQELSYQYSNNIIIYGGAKNVKD